jgi:RHS repeat-associated protein
MRIGKDDYWYHLDDQNTVLSIRDANGLIVERYSYDAHGIVQISSATHSPVTASLIVNPYASQGRRLDQESGWYYFRHRYYDPSIGRFTSRDPLGMWCDPASFGNGYTSAGNNPATWLDLYGLNCTCNPMLDDIDIRIAIEQAWEMTIASGEQPGTLGEWFGSLSGQTQFTQEEHGFLTYRNEDGDYWASEVTDGGDCTWPLPLSKYKWCRRCFAHPYRRFKIWGSSKPARL